MADVVFVRDGGPNIAIEFVVDTGFRGTLALPPPAVLRLGLARGLPTTAKLTDGSTVQMDVYVARIAWDSAVLDVAVLATGDRPLLGTTLLEHKRLLVDFEDGGVVVIRGLP
jgi:clan AA aspartic protease